MRFPATPGWGPLVVVVGVPSPLLAEGPGGCSSSSLPGRGLLVAVAWRCRARVLVCCVVVRGPSPSPWPWCVCVCVCVCCVLPRVGVGAVWGSCVPGLRRVCVCACGVWFFWGMSYLDWFALSADMVTIKGRKGGPVNVQRVVGLGGGRCDLYPCSSPSFGVCSLCLCFASWWYLQNVEVRLGVVLRVTVLLRGSVLCLALCLAGFGSITYLTTVMPCVFPL